MQYSSVQDNSNSSPDIITDKDALKLLSKVGSALRQVYSDATHTTDFFIAKDALQNFKVYLLNSNISPEVKKGLTELHSYLLSKIDRRLKNANVERDKPIT